VADTLVGVQLWREQTPLVYAERIDAAGVAGALAEQIARLNRAGKMSFKEAMSLRVGGLDRYSRWHLQDLVVAVGAAGVAVVEAAFPGEAEEVALRGTRAGASRTIGHSQGAGGSGAAGEGDKSPPKRTLAQWDSPRTIAEHATHPWRIGAVTLTNQLSPGRPSGIARSWRGA
jgi:hypothetical protein